jgi:hypothetical protein
MTKAYSVWVRPVAGSEMQPIGSYVQKGAAIRLAEKAFDEKGYHQVAVIENRSMGVVFVVHA